MKRTVDEILLELVDTIEDAMDDTMDAKFIQQAFDGMTATEDYLEYLRRTVSMDLRRYYSAQSEKERENVRGAMQRTLYERGKWIQKHTRELKQSQ